MAYGDFKDLTKKAASKNQKYDGYRRGLALMIYKLFDKYRQ